MAIMGDFDVITVIAGLHYRPKSPNAAETRKAEHSVTALIAAMTALSLHVVQRGVEALVM